MIPNYTNIDPKKPLESIQFAGFTVRALAWVIDSFILIPFSIGVAYFSIFQPSLLIVITFIILDSLYKPIMEYRFGWTIGKRIMRLKVIDQVSLGRITLNQSFLRYIPWAIVAFTSIFLATRYFQASEFAAIDSWEGYLEFMQDSPLNQNTIVGMLKNAPMFSVISILFDFTRRALHDRLAVTFVVHDPKPVTKDIGWN